MHQILPLWNRIQKTFNRQRKITKVLLGFICVVILFAVGRLCISNSSNESFETSKGIEEFNYTNDESCHYIDGNDALPSVLGKDFAPPARSIFFHETSCKGGLHSRQACAVESAARKNPKWQINVLFSGPVSKDSLNRNALKELQSFENVKLYRVRLDKYAKDTVLDDIVAKKTFEKHKLEVIEILKYLTLFKWGGVYMDLDFIVMREFNSLEKNWVVRENTERISDVIICLSRDRVGKQVAKLALRELHDRVNSRNIQTSKYIPIITKALYQTCRYADLSLVSTKSCNGVEIYDPQHFFPIPYPKWEEYFKPDSISSIVNEFRYTHHFANKLSRNRIVPGNSMYAGLAQIYCPTIYKLYGSRFGI